MKIITLSLLNVNRLFTNLLCIIHVVQFITVFRYKNVYAETRKLDEKKTENINTHFYHLSLIYTSKFYLFYLLIKINKFYILYNITPASRKRNGK